MKVYRIYKDEKYYSSTVAKKFFIKKKCWFWWKTLLNSSENRMQFYSFEEAEQYIMELQKDVVLVKEVSI